MAPPTAAKTKKQVQLAPPPPPPQQDEDNDEVRQLVMGRWRSSLGSGLRASLACTVVGLVSLYAPEAVRRHITFPAFSYVVTVIIVTDASLGTALRGAVSALHGTLMGAAPSVVALWLAHHTGAAESVVATSAVVALTAFAVALPSSSVGPVAKRIALGQAIIIYVANFRQGEHPSRDLALLHPANVVACTALGVAAALLAVLLPWPRLATREARDKSRAYRVVAAERVRALADAFAVAVAVAVDNNDVNEEADEAACSRQRRWQMAACMSEAKRLASASTTLLNRMSAIKEDLQWERAVVLVDDNKSSSSSMEVPLTGMHIALAMMQQQQADGHGNKQGMRRHMLGLVMAMRDQIRLGLLTPNSKSSLYHLPTTTSSSSTNCDCDCDYEEQQLSAPFLLFLFSLYQLRHHCCGACADGPKTALTAAAAVPNASQVAPAASTTAKPSEQEEEEGKTGQQADPLQAASAAAAQDQVATRSGEIDNIIKANNHHHHHFKFLSAAKCGFSLGLAVLLGLLFSNDHGFWSGLIVATTMTVGRESTWAVAVGRAHGTALGSIYGVLGCLLMSQQNLLTMDLRFVALLPWMVVATFLKRSRAYGPAGGVAAALSVVIIMGRRYDEAPMAFTIARLVETFIGIACAVLADIMFQPGARPSVQAREQLTRCIAALADCLVADETSSETKRVQQELALLRNHAAEAGSSEPTYLWLPPFPATCYDNIQGSLGRMAQLLQLYHQARIIVQTQMEVDDTSTITIIQRRRRRRFVSTSLSHCLRMLAPPPNNKSTIYTTRSTHQEDKCHQVIDLDLEAGSSDDCVGSFGDAALSRDDRSRSQEETRLLSLGTIAVCMGEMVKEAHTLEVHIIDLNNLQLASLTE